MRQPVPLADVIRAHARQRRKRQPFMRLFDEDRRARLLQALKDGASLKSALAYAGLSRSTFQRWRQHARAKPRSPLARLLRDVREAKAHALVTAHRHWQAGFGRDWRAAESYVIRADPAFRLGRETGPDGGVTLNFDYAGLLQEIWKTHPPRLASEQRHLPAAPTHHELEPVVEKWRVPERRADQSASAPRSDVVS